jgi:hypothetical protein
LCSFISDRPLGTAVLGGFMFARGSGQEHWEEVKKFSKQHIQKWHVMQPLQGRDTPN